MEEQNRIQGQYDRTDYEYLSTKNINHNRRKKGENSMYSRDKSPHCERGGGGGNISRVMGQRRRKYISKIGRTNI